MANREPDNEQLFLDRVRVALGRDKAAPADPKLFASRPARELETLLERADRDQTARLELLGLLKATATPLNLHVHEAATLEAAGRSIADLARSSDTEWGGDKRIVTHADPLLEGLGLAEKLHDDGIFLDVAQLEPGNDELTDKHRLRGLAEAAFMGVTGADWCAADCAAIALLTGPGRGRAVSLVPSIHVAVLPLNRLLADLPELYAQLERLDRLPTSFNFISGPSKTADIEAQLVHGAHGPREMHLFVVTG